MTSTDSLPSIASVTQSVYSLTVVASKWPSLWMTSRNPLPLAACTWFSLWMISIYGFLTLFASTWFSLRMISIYGFLTFVHLYMVQSTDDFYLRIPYLCSPLHGPVYGWFLSTDSLPLFTSTWSSLRMISIYGFLTFGHLYMAQSADDF